MNELKERIAECFGLEISPDGYPYQLLEYDENNNVIAGIDYEKEVEQLATFIRQKELEARIRELQWAAYSIGDLHMECVGVPDMDTGTARVEIDRQQHNRIIQNRTAQLNKEREGM